jgi:hypothetical protein
MEVWIIVPIFCRPLHQKERHFKKTSKWVYLVYHSKKNYGVKKCKWTKVQISIYQSHLIYIYYIYTIYLYLYILYIYINSIYIILYIIYYIIVFFMFFLGSPIVPFDSFKPSLSEALFVLPFRHLAQVVLEPLGRWSPGCPCLTVRISSRWPFVAGNLGQGLEKCGYIIETYCAQAWP